MNDGRISKLEISLRNRDILKELMTGQPPQSIVLCRYDRGLDIDRIRPGTEAVRLYQMVIAELN